MVWGEHASQVRLEAGATRVLGPKLQGEHVVDAGDGFSCGDTPGVSGTLVIAVAAPAPPGTVTLVFKGGIVTSVTGAAPGTACTWTPS